MDLKADPARPALATGTPDDARPSTESHTSRGVMLAPYLLRETQRTPRGARPVDQSKPPFSPSSRFDPRLYQIAVLSGLLAYGVTRLHFEIGLAQAIVTLGVALATQAVCSRLSGLPRFDPKSALISGLSLCLLLRTNSLLLVAITAIVTIASKFVIRWKGKHVFNPTNFGIVAMMLVTGAVWVSPGQWGNVAFFGFLMACLGGLVVNRAARSDVTYAFIASFLAIQFGYAMWLGQPLATPLHRMQNGALLLFTFFMISDPRTTPNSRVGRILFALLVAAGAAFVQLAMFRTNGLLWSLALFSMLVPVIDRLLPGRRYEWRAALTRPETSGGVEHETPFAVPRPAGAHAMATGRP